MSVAEKFVDKVLSMSESDILIALIKIDESGIDAAYSFPIKQIGISRLEEGKYDITMQAMYASEVATMGWTDIIFSENDVTVGKGEKEGYYYINKKGITISFFFTKVNTK